MLILPFFFTRHIRWGFLLCRCAFKVRGCPISIWDPFSVFHLKTLLLVMLYPPIDLLASPCFFWCNLLVRFVETFGPRLFRLSPWPLDVPIAFFPHFLWGYWLQFHKVHYINNLLGNWAFVKLIIASKFWSDHHPFLLEAIGANSFGLFPLYDLRLAHQDSPRCGGLCSLFGQFVKKGIDWFQENISNKLHDHSFSDIISKMILNSHHAHIEILCAGPRVCAWLFAHLVILSFHLAFNFFYSVLHIRLGVPHPLTLGLIHYICGQTLNLMGTHLLCCSHGGEWIASHNVVQNVFTSIVKNTWFHVSKPMSFYYPLFNFFFGGLTSCNSWWHPHFNQCCHCWSHLGRFGFIH